MRSHVQHWYTKHLCFFFFFQTELNVLPVICLIYCLFNIAKMLQGVKGEVAPRRVASSKNVHRSYYQPWGLRLYIEKQAVWMWAGLPHWARIHTDLWLCDFMAEHMRQRQSERAILQRSSTLLPSNHSTVKKRAKTKRKPTSNACLLLSWVDALKMHSHSSIVMFSLCTCSRTSKRLSKVSAFIFL